MDGEEFKRLTERLDKLAEQIYQLPTREQFAELKTIMVTRDYMDGKYDGLSLRLTYLERKHDQDIEALTKALDEERKARAAAELTRQERLGIRIAQVGVVLTILTQIISLAGRVKILP